MLECRATANLGLVQRPTRMIAVVHELTEPAISSRVNILGNWKEEVLHQE